MSKDKPSFSLVTVRIEETTAANLCDLTAASDLSGVHPDLIRDLCYAGYLHPRVTGSDDNWLFDDDAVYTLRRIHELREVKGVNLRGVRVILDLTRQLLEVERELKYLRDRLL